MSVEGGSVGGVGVAGAAAPVVVNEGPVSLSALEGFRSMNISDINPIDKGGTIAPQGEIVFRPSGFSVLEQAEAVAAKAWGENELPTPAQAVSQAEAIISEAVIVPLVLPITTTIVEDNGFLAVNPSPKTEARVSHQVARAVSPQPLLPASPASRLGGPELQRGEQEQMVEEEVLEKVRVEDPVDELEEEEIEKRLFLEDEKASAVRKLEIKQAIKLAFASVKNTKLSTIVGSLVAGFLPGEHAGNRSSALKDKGPDGSYEETVEAIASSGEFSSPEQAEKRFEEIVAEKKPVKNAKEGSPVAEEDVARVFKFRAVKPPTAVEIFTKRVVKKTVQVSTGQSLVESKPETSETSLKDYPELVEVFRNFHLDKSRERES